ncbi:MAG: sigma-54-dependent Fis family transcriptional regulator [Verrucomicrobiaceae bacterium]|nr:sigma-54-dependent Fis family transcriptional regulator [Verrucomicrobiaceae bacterium]
MLPRLLVLDDQFGRNLPEGPNPDRENLCAHFLWEDVTGDASARTSQQKVLQPTAEAVFCRAQSPACSDSGDTVENDLEMALEAVRKGWPEAGLKRRGRPPKTPPPRWSMVLIDLCFYTGRVTEESHRRTPGMPEGRPGDDDPRSYFGLTLLDAIHREFPELPIFILSSKPRGEVSLEFSRRGALGFIDRSALDGPELLEQALWNHGLLADPTGEVVGQSLPILLAQREARRASKHGQNILIRGERGTGKELIARYVHRGAKPVEGRQVRAFVPVNSPALTPRVFASELYGIEPKTATGVDGKIGLIEMANGGDVFLDEIADMAPEVQASLLRVIQEQQITRVGARKPKEVDVRFIAATNAEIVDEEHELRPDLLDRLSNGGTIWLPPLRDRLTDIPLLVEKFVRQAESRRSGILARNVTSEALDKLQSYDWPGNIRELQTAIFDAVNRHPDVEHLVPDHLRLGTAGKAAPRRGRPPNSERLGRLAQADNWSRTLDGLLQRMDETTFNAQEVGQWAGRLDDVRNQQQQLIGRMIQAALDATKRRTPENPSGFLQIHPALKLLTGNPKLTATKAADALKRLLGPNSGSLQGDLKEAYEIAIRLRPKGIKTEQET